MKKIQKIFLLLAIVTGLFGCDMLTGPDGDRQRDNQQESLPDENSISRSTSDMWITAYMASWNHYAPPTGNWGNLPTDEIDWTAFTHMNYFAFGVHSDGSLSEVADYQNLSPDRIEAIVSAAHEHDTPIIFTIGGWGNYEGFSSAISDANRSTLVNNLISTLNTWNFDGIDLDMEPINSSDYDNYIAFVNELHSALQEETTPMTETPLLVAATGGDAELFAQIHDKFDQINIMTYDYSGAWQGWVTWHNAPIYNGGETFPELDRTLPSANKSVDEFINAGVPNEKIGIGIDFYGYVWEGVSEPLQSWDTAPTVTDNVPFHEIMDTYYTSDRERWDGNAEAAYLSINNTSGETFISYDNQRTVESKIKYIRSKDIGGAIIWELSGGYRENQSAGERDNLLQSVKQAVSGGIGIDDPADTTPPEVLLVNPAAGDTVSDTVTLQAEASDNNSVDRVEFLVNQNTVDTDNGSAPYEVSWSTTDVADGEHTVVARAVDEAGNTQSASSTVYVQNSMTDPPSGDNHYIYNDELQQSWINVSWSADVNTQSTRRVYSGSNSIRLQTSSWGALALRHDEWGSLNTLSTDGYQSLSFQVYFENDSGSFQVWFKNGEGNVIQKVGTDLIQPGTWTTVRLSLDNLNPDNEEIIRVAFQEASGGSRTFYVDDLKLEGEGSDGGSPAAPNLLSPVDGASTLDNPVNLEWSPVDNANGYDLQVSTEADFSTIVDQQTGLGNTSYSLGGLRDATEYHWRVRADNSGNTGEWSSSWSFSTASSSPPAGEAHEIYGEQLNDPWIDASWNADLTLQNTEHISSGDYSLRVETSAWGALSVRHGLWGGSAGTFSTDSYESLRFDVYFANQEGSLQVWFKDADGNVIQGIGSGTIEPGGWTTVTLSLDQLNPDNVEINRVSMQEYSGSSRTFYIDNLKLQ